MLQPNLTAYHAAFLTSAVLALTAACIALFIRDRDAAATMRRPNRPENAPAPKQEVLVEM